jgi:hypothetical protein
VKAVRQCKTCPWRVDVVPSRDVPNYDPGIYDRMRASLRTGIDSIRETTRMVMECHNGKKGANRACAGWLHHQIGVGNNLGVRMRVITGHLPVPKVVGEQHEDLDGLSESPDSD